MAGEHGDGSICVAMTDPGDVRGNVAAVREGAKRAGRTLPGDFNVTAMTNAVVLRPGEKPTSERALDETDAWVGAIIPRTPGKKFLQRPVSRITFAFPANFASFARSKGDSE